MRKPRSISTLLFSIFVTVVTVSCVSTKLQDQWSNTYTRKLASQRVMVIVVAKQPELRKAFEDQFVARLRDENVNAVPSYPYLTGSGPAPMETVKQALQQNGIDSVFVARLIDVGQKGQTNDPSMNVFWGYYPAAFAAEPPKYAYTTYTTDVRLFDLKEDKLIWAGTLQTDDPNDIKNDVNKIAQQYVDRVVKALNDLKIIS